MTSWLIEIMIQVIFLTSFFTSMIFAVFGAYHYIDGETSRRWFVASGFCLLLSFLIIIFSHLMGL